ncbi:MAG: FHA domain-containing protein [Pseudomonadota bacterium]
MPKMIVSVDGVAIREVQLTKSVTAVGRRPYNDIVIENLSVSGEHALLEVQGEHTYLQDLNSTNGTQVNGKPIKKVRLNHDDVIEIGRYRLQYLAPNAESANKPDSLRSPLPLTMPGPDEHTSSPMDVERATGAAGTAGQVPRTFIRVLSDGPVREMDLVKPVTTLGRPGEAVVAITRRQDAFTLVHVEGGGMPLLNSVSVGHTPVALKSGDVITVAGNMIEFCQQ